MEARNLAETIYIEYFHDIRRLDQETLRSLVDELWTGLYFPSYQLSFEFLLGLCQDPLPLNIRVLVVRQKSDRKVIGNIMCNISKIKHMDNDEREVNQYLIVFGYICVSKQHRQLYLSTMLLQTLTAYILEEDGLVNIIYINMVASPFNFSHAMKRGKFCIPSIDSGITNPECEKMMFKYLASANTGCTGRRSEENPYVFTSGVLFDNDYNYVRQNYDSLDKYVKYFADITNLEQGCMVSVFLPIYIIEGNTLGLEAGFNIPRPIMFNGEIRTIN